MFINLNILVAVCGMLLSEVWAKEFTSYWNVPSFACSHKHKLPFVNVTEKYGIKQNFDDNFRGDQVSILYDPGQFPALLKNSSSKELFHRNGGVPQKGNLRAHLEMFEKHVDELIPDKDNSGLAIIDFESWRPVYRQNFGVLQPYKDLSTKLVRQSHPWWSKSDIENEAKIQFSSAAKLFILETLSLAKKLRPNAKWRYYGLPF